jgi:hypothetical protein
MAASSVTPNAGLANHAQNPAIAVIPAPAYSNPSAVAGPSRRYLATTLSRATPGVTASTAEPASRPVTAVACAAVPAAGRGTAEARATTSAATTGAASHPYGHWRLPGRACPARGTWRRKPRPARVRLSAPSNMVIFVPAEADDPRFERTVSPLRHWQRIQCEDSTPAECQQVAFTLATRMTTRAMLN